GDELAMRLLLAMNGSFTTLNLADKSNLYWVDGIPLLKDSYETQEDGSVRISDGAIQQFVDYFLTEYSRMGAARAEAQRLAANERVQYYHDGNAFRSAIFPEL